MEGNADVDIEMLPIKMAIRRHVKNRDAFTDIFNRAYETLMLCMGKIADLRGELAALKEQIRWRKYPDEKPEAGKWCEVVTAVYDFAGDMLLGSGEWTENVGVLYWRYSDAPEPPEA